MQSPARDAVPNPMARPQPPRTHGPATPATPTELQQIFERLARPLLPARTS
ncbi:MAG: hypothetical protein JWQ90_5126 [Hydrocarboniphaga sp.]|uniref:hypothetical protein n=1 Tax=Hydrocarboniphaga sp. TaxID=2033016 RepID=UPI002634F472|nr:hypothetical protein [Hydrocarboniphaga sp.]MDB5972676.1 hypothetical protein [Hydrocarboniphaga sp.]